MNELSTLINSILKETNYSNNLYFSKLNDGEFEKPDFVETQIQFYYAVVFFSRPMAALAAKIPTPEQRVSVLKNVWEEHGEGTLAHGHGSTFLQFLSRLDNISHGQVLQRGLWPEVRIFNTTLIGACVLDDFLVSASLLGMVERMFSEISSWIGQGVIKRGWVKQNEMVHYKVHSELDVIHAQDFFDILTEPFEKRRENRYQIEQGLRLGATLFNNLYLGLWNNRKTRWILNNHIPASHSGIAIP